MTKGVYQFTGDDLQALSGPAVLANRFFVTIGPSGVRIAFAEQFGPETKPTFRTAVVISFQDGIELSKLLAKFLEPVEQNAAALKKSEK